MVKGHVEELEENCQKMEDRGWGGVDPRYCPSLPRRGLEGGEAGTGVGRARAGGGQGRPDALGAGEAWGEGAGGQDVGAIREEQCPSSPRQGDQRRGRQVRGGHHAHGFLGVTTPEGPMAQRERGNQAEGRGG